MKIAIIGSRGYPYVYSGYETFVRELGERLVAAGFDVTVYCHRNLFRERPRLVNGIRLVYIPTVERKTLSQFVHSFQATLHACFRRYDVVLVVNAANGPFGVLFRLFRRKTAINVDGLEWLRPKWHGLGAKYFLWAAKAATRLYDEVIADSAEIGRIYQKKFHCRPEVIAYGADIRESRNPERIVEWGLEKLGYYLVVGRLIPDNNADLIVRGFLKSASKRKLVIVGDVSYRDAYAERIKAVADPRLVFTGYVNDADDLSELYHHCYGYFHGHEFGGTNPSLLQALACGCAVCALDTVFSREVLKNGEYGLFFPKDEDTLVQAIARMERGPEMMAEFRRKSRFRIRDEYTWEKIAGQYIRLFERLARRNP
jgi:glycosyltransferase involved in cell wall biosynthesis